MPDEFLPYGRQSIDEDDIAAVADVLRGDWLTTGPAVAAFEVDLAAATGAEFAVACNSGTAALHLATMALNIGPGDAVIVPAVTFAATANAVRYTGAEVVFADVDPETGLLRAEDFIVAQARVPEGLNLRAVFPVHLNGQCVDMPALSDAARQANAHIVEDACHALGTTYNNGTPVGSAVHSDLVAFSFHPVKTIAMGEGGAVTGGDGPFADSIRALRSHGIVHDASAFERRDLAVGPDGRDNPWYQEQQALGFNYRASDVNCALGRSQLAKLLHFVRRRRALAERYDDRLGSLAPLLQPVGRVPHCAPAWHLYVVLLNFDRLGLSRAFVMERLMEAGIGTQVHYVPVPWQPYYRQRYGDQEFPGARAYYEQCLSLPLFPAMEERHVDRVVSALTTVIGMN